MSSNLFLKKFKGLELSGLAGLSSELLLLKLLISGSQVRILHGSPVQSQGFQGVTAFWSPFCWFRSCLCVLDSAYYFTRIMQLTTEHTEEHIDSKRETISFYGFRWALFYVRLNLIIFKKITRGHRELLESKSLFKVKNTSVSSVVLFKFIFSLISL